MKRYSLFFLGLALVALIASLALSGCGNFFVYPPSLTASTGSTGSTGTTTSTTDYVYASNSTSGSAYLAGYSVGSGLLTAATGAPFALSVIPLAMAITPSNAYLYVAAASSNGLGVLYGYSIGTGGTLTTLAGGVALLTENIAAMDVSPDGKYLFVLDSNGITINQYQINTSNGTLTSGYSYQISSGTNGGVVTPVGIKVAPTGAFFVVALGTGGVETFSLNSSTGAGTAVATITPATTSIGIYAVGVDANNYLYTAGTVGLQVFSTAAGLPTLISGTPYTTGSAPVSIAITKTSSFLYTANSGDGTISGFSIGSKGVLTALAGSPFTAPAGVTALARDTTGSYLFAAGRSATNGHQLFTISSSGALSTAASTGSGTTAGLPIAAVASF